MMSESEFFMYLIDENVTRKKFMNWSEFKLVVSGFFVPDNLYGKI